MKACFASRADISKYFSGTYVKIPETGEKVLYKVSVVSSEGITLYGTNGAKGFISFEEGSSYDLQNPLPRRSMWGVDVKGQAIFITRIPARMWKKGIHEENTASFKLFGGGLCSTVFDPKSQNNIFFAPVEREVKCKTGSIYENSWLLSKGKLFYKNVLVGMFGNGKNTIYMPKELRQLVLPPALRKHTQEFV